MVLRGLIVLSVWLCSGFAIADGNPWAGPIWKFHAVPENSNAEFDGHDPYGLSVGVYIKTDCSIRWVWRYDKKCYCFNSLTSKAYFMDRPHYYIKSAKAFILSEKNAMD